MAGLSPRGWWGQEPLALRRRGQGRHPPMDCSVPREREPPWGYHQKQTPDGHAGLGRVQSFLRLIQHRHLLIFIRFANPLAQSLNIGTLYWFFFSIPSSVITEERSLFITRSD